MDLKRHHLQRMQISKVKRWRVTGGKEFNEKAETSALKNTGNLHGELPKVGYDLDEQQQHTISGEELQLSTHFYGYRDI